MPHVATRKRIVRSVRRIAVKIGTNAISDDTGRLHRRTISHLAAQIAAIMDSGVNVTVISSGAVGAGMSELDLAERPGTMPGLQAVAAVGQGGLMRTFHDVFARRGIRVAQVLLTRDDFEDRTRYLNIRNTLAALAEHRALPIINENDVVAVDELRYGDNDVIAAHVANMIAADLLVLLTVVDGVFKDGEVLDVIGRVNDETLALASGTRSTLGSGGMKSKLAAVGMVTRAGEAAVIANARTPNVLTRLLAGEQVGTLFLPAKRRMSSRRRWIAQASRPAGKIIIDDGAARALTRRGKSLLPSGITAVDGRFPKGATVSILTVRGREIARGLTNYSAEHIEKIKGLRSSQIAAALGDKPYDEVIHRNNMTLG